MHWVHLLSERPAVRIRPGTDGEICRFGEIQNGIFLFLSVSLSFEDTGRIIEVKRDRHKGAEDE